MASQAQEADDPFGGGFLVSQDHEIFTMGRQADSLHGLCFDWLSDMDSLLLIADGDLLELYVCGEDRDIAAGDLNGYFPDELMAAWSRLYHGILVL